MQSPKVLLDKSSLWKTHNQKLKLKLRKKHKRTQK